MSERVAECNGAEPKISIIVPAFNSEDTLAEAIGSVLGQSYGSWELIIVDDGSTDNTRELLQGYDDARIAIVHQSNRGVSSARNAGLDRATGQYLTFLDADDLLAPECLCRVSEEIEFHPDATFLAGQVEIIDGQNMTTIGRWCPCYSGDPLVPFVRLDEKVFYGVCLFVKAVDVCGLRFRDGLTHCEDLCFFVEIASVTETSFVSMSFFTYLRRVFPSTAMSDLKGLEAGYRALFRVILKLNSCGRRVGKWDLLYLKLRYTRIMVLCHLKRADFKAALRSLLHLRTIREVFVNP